MPQDPSELMPITIRLPRGTIDYIRRKGKPQFKKAGQVARDMIVGIQRAEVLRDAKKKKRKPTIVYGSAKSL